MKFATNTIRHYPSHLKHVTTLPLEIENSNFLQWKKMQTSCILVASGFVIDPQFYYFGV